MTNLVVFVLMMAASVLSGPALKTVTELAARGAVAQDEGVAKPPPAPQVPPGKSLVTQASVPVLAVANVVPAVATVPTPAAQPVSVSPPTPSLPSGSKLPVDDKPVSATQDEEENTAYASPSATMLALIGDTPTRRPDGTVFLPITLQRMAGMRTGITAVKQFAATQEIAGRIVTSRDVSAMIQATQSGVIEAVGNDVPRVGDKVQAGQLLAYQRPIIDAARQAEIDAKVAELRGLIDMGEQRIARLREVLLIRYRASKIDAVEAEVENYRRELRIYDRLMSQRVEIRARSAGVISKVNFVAGQIVEPQTTLFEIVDPSKLWVEAASFDAALANDIAGASAVTGDGRVLPLQFVGGGLMLQNQAVPLQFNIVGRIDDLQVGKPVTVIVRRRQSQSAGILLPSSAVLHGPTGGTMVWQKLSAESFVSRPVSIKPLDGNDVVVTGGITPDMRIVTADSEMLSQVR